MMIRKAVNGDPRASTHPNLRRPLQYDCAAYIRIVRLRHSWPPAVRAANDLVTRHRVIDYSAFARED